MDAAEQHGLAGIGVRSGDRVAILSRNSHAFAALRFALARLGAVLVPINFMLTAEEIADRLGVSRPTGFRYARELSAAALGASLA